MSEVEEKDEAAATPSMVAAVSESDLGALQNGNGHKTPNQPSEATTATATAAAAEGDEDEVKTSRWQWIFSPSDMALTPSVLHSRLTPEQEQYKRWKGVRLIFQIGDYMRLGNHATCTAAVFFHRFYMRKAMPSSDVAADRPHDTYTFQEMAPTCIFLACKVEEAHRKLHGIVEATMAVLDRTPTGIERAEAHIYRADVNSRDYRRWKDIVLLHEERLLETLCFDMIIDQPHPIAIKACQRMTVSRDMAQLTIVVLNSLLYGAACTFSDAATLAACAFKKACEYVERDPNSWFHDTKYAGHSWTEAFDVDDDEVEEAMPAIEAHLAYHQERLAPITPAAAAQTSVATPLPSQVQTVMTADDGAALQESSNLTAGANEAINTEHNRAAFIPADVDSGANQVDQTDSTPMSFGHDHQADIRPVSRHGSKMGKTGPPPPLSTSPVQDAEAKEAHEKKVAEKVIDEQERQEAVAEAGQPASTGGKGNTESEEEGAL